MIATGQSHASHTDDAVFHFQRALALLRATFLEAGARLVAAGHLDHADDVFHLERDEVWAGQESPGQPPSCAGSCAISRSA